MRLEDKIEEIRIYGSLNYTANQIGDALELTTSHRAELTQRLLLPNDVLAIAYRKGFITAEQKTDISLAKQAQTGDVNAIEMQDARTKQRRIAKMKKDLFGI